MRKISIVFVLLLLVVAVTGVILLATEGVKMKENIQIHTETEPIYNHFPDLPETSEIQWCSRSSEGVGLTTTTVYFFAFYDHDVSNELQGMVIQNQDEDVALYFVPAGINENEKWRHVENARIAFQTSIKITQKMQTNVYINESGTILYIEAIGN